MRQPFIRKVSTALLHAISQLSVLWRRHQKFRVLLKLFGGQPGWCSGWRREGVRLPWGTETDASDGKREDRAMCKININVCMRNKNTINTLHLIRAIVFAIYLLYFCSLIIYITRLVFLNLFSTDVSCRTIHFAAVIMWNPTTVGLIKDYFVLSYALVGSNEKNVKGCKSRDEIETEAGLDLYLQGSGEASLWDGALGLLPAANPVAWITLMCCWPSSSTDPEFWRNCEGPARREEGCSRYGEAKGVPSSWLSGVDFPSAVWGLFFLLSQVFCVSRWVGVGGGRGKDSVSCQLLLGWPHSGSSVS